MGRPRLSRSRAGSRKTARPEGPATNKEMREASLSDIEESAIACFLENGVRSTSVEQIAARAGLTKGGFYFHFPKKDLLISHIIKRIQTDYIEQSINVASRTGSAKDRLISMMHQQVIFARDHRREVALLVLMSLEFRDDSEIGDQLRGVYDKVRSFVRAVFLDGQKSGEFTNSVSSEALAHFYVAVHDGFLMELVRSGDTIDGPELVRAYRESLLRGILAGGRSGRLPASGQSG
jgi:AcrR family transcriptional regulator